MAEIFDDLKISNVEINSNLGINLTPENSRIKHTGTGIVELSSNGTILLKSGDSNVEDSYFDNLGNVGNIILEGGYSQNGLAGNILLVGGNSLENGLGGSVLLAGGNNFLNGGYGVALRTHTSLLNNQEKLLNNNLMNTKMVEKKNEILNKVQKSQNLNSLGELKNHSEGTTSIGGGIFLVAGDKEEDFILLGDVIITAGQAYNTASGGNILLASGNNFDEGEGGDFIISAGQGGSNGITGLANGGDIIINSGTAGNNSVGGNVILSGGDYGGHSNSRGGRIVMESLMTLPTFDQKPDRDSIEQAEGVTGDISFITGSQVLCLHDGEQWSNLPIPNTDTYFKYFKWEITKVSYTGFSGDNGIQASEFKFTNDGIDISMAGITCTTNATDYVGGNSVSNLIDGNLNTFWYSNIIALEESVKVYFEFPTAVQTDGYRWATGTDAPQRDPVSWKVYGSNNNSLWVQLDELTDYSSINNQIARKTYIVLRYDIDNRKELVSYNDDLALKALNGNDVNISSEPAITGPPGRINMLNVMRSVVFANDTERNTAIPSPQIGDICFVISGGNPSGNLKLQVYTDLTGEGASGWQICN